MEIIKKEELINILKYAYFMSRVVSPISAKRVGLYNTGGEICDFYKYLIEAIEKDEPLDFSKDPEDDFLSSVYNDYIVPDINNRDITYDGFFVAVKKNNSVKEYDDIEK